MIVFDPLHIGADQGYLLEDGLPVGPGEPLEIPVGEGDHCHGQIPPSASVMTGVSRRN